VLLDCGPDFRQQILNIPFKKLDAVLLTHVHYDHVGGLDDLRPFCIFGDVDVFANLDTAKGLIHSMPYCFAEKKYPGVPQINLHVIKPHQVFKLGDISVTPIEVIHGKLPILGYRLDDLVYITDMKEISESEYAYLKNVKILVVNALRWEMHPTHQSIYQAIEFAERVHAESTYFIHMSHHAGLYAETDLKIPQSIHLSYDGLSLSF